MDQSVTPTMVSLRTACAMLNLRESFLYRNVRAGNICAVKCGRVWRISVKEIERIAAEGIAGGDDE